MARASLNRLSPRRRGVLAALALLAGLALALALAAAGGLLEGRPEGISVPPGPAGTGSIADVAEFEPFAFEDGDPDDLLERGRDGYAHPLYAFSPGGAGASAARVARYRSRVEAAAERHDVEPDTLEALVMLESAGRPEVAAGDDPEGAVGLGQILPETATSLLGMSVDLEASKRLTRAIERQRGRVRRSRRAGGRVRRGRGVPQPPASPERRRRAVDERYDPVRSLDGAARYLAIAERRLGREDLAVVSYHMGLGNLEQVIEAYVAPARPRRTLRGTVEAYDVSYARLFYDSSPLENRRTYSLLADFGDDSRSYLLRIDAARENMRLHRDDRRELARLERLHAPAERRARAAPAAGDRVPPGPRGDGRGLRRRRPRPPSQRPRASRLRPRPGARHARGGRGDRTRPQPLPRPAPRGGGRVALHHKEVERVAGRSGLRVTDAARDEAYGRRLAAAGEPLRPFSLHSTGFSFDIAREYPSPRVRRAFAYILERLRALRLIDYVYEPEEIHVTVGPDAERLLELQEALVPAQG